MIRHFFLDRTNTIIEGSKYNCGLNPIMQISYGKGVSRGLLHFDIDEIKKNVEENVSDTEKLTFKLHMTNCASVDTVPFHDTLLRGKTGVAERASSFTLDFYKAPSSWDEGSGFDFQSDFWIHDRKVQDLQGSTWYQSATAMPWSFDMGSGLTIETYGAYNKDMSVFVAKQSFDFGDEDINIDITNYVKELIAGETNTGLLVKIDKDDEKLTAEYIVDFFTNHTNTFFHPYVEMIYDEPICDDREACYIGKENKLYLYTNIGGEPQNLDEMPVCEIDGVEYPVEKAQKGVYFARIRQTKDETDADTIHYDTWSNLALNGQEIEDIEMEFVALDGRRYFKVGEETAFEDRTVPSVYGINANEDILRGETREVVVDFRRKFTTDKKVLNCNAEYRIYIKDGNREYTVIGFNPVEKSFLNNFFVIHTQDFVPGKYFIDIKVNEGRTTRFYKDVLHYNIVSEVRERYQ